MTTENVQRVESLIAKLMSIFCFMLENKTKHNLWINLDEELHENRKAAIGLHESVSVNLWE